MKCFVSVVCILSVFLVSSNAAPADYSASTSVQVGSNASPAPAGGGIATVFQNIDIPGLLRGVNSFVKLVGQFCPPLSQVLDNVIQNVTSTAFRIFGRIILRNGGLGGGQSSSSGGQRVNVVLPTFPPDEDYDEEEEDDSEETSASTSRGLPLSNDVPTESSLAANAPYTSPADGDNSVAKRHVRVAREAESDQDGAESAPEPSQDLSDIEDDADRSKRFSPFGGDGHASGGSGNFLFDIIRLVAGSGATEESDEKENAPGGVAEVDVGKAGDGYTEGIPGPITRLLVIANRGLANLVQDLILRLAQTSERLVNFKARLVTSLI